MQLRRKAYTTAIITFLMLSLVLATVPVAKASSLSVNVADSDNDDVGPVGEEVKVSGTSTTPGGKLEIYWDEVHAWDPETKTGLIVSDYAVGTSYSINFTVPEAVAGEHYVIVKDVEAADIESTTYTVVPKIKLTPSIGLPGDTVNVEGTGFAGTSYIDIYFGNSTFVENSTTTTFIHVEGNETSTLEFNGTLPNAPVIPTSVNITLTINVTAVSVIDDGLGNLLNATTVEIDGSYANATGTINYASGFFEFNVTADSADLYVTSANATYVRSLEDVTPTGLKTGSLGSFTASFKVPSVSDGNYEVWAIDGEGNSDYADFEVSHLYIILEPTEGLAGITVTISGRGFTENSYVDVYFGIDGFRIKVLDDVPTDAYGNFEAEFMVPEEASPTTYVVTAIDREDITVQTFFTVLWPPEIRLSPTRGLPGDEITVEGFNFTASSEITLYFDTTVLETDPATIITNAEGSFTATFVVPEVDPGKYTVKAVDEEGLEATATFTVTIEIFEVETRATEYLRGDSISFYINSSDPINMTIVIDDPTEIPWYYIPVCTEPVTGTAGWMEVEGYWTIPYSNLWGITLPSDAPLGLWNWTAYECEYTVQDGTLISIELGDPITSGNFTVLERPTLATILDRLDELDVKLSGLITDAEGNLKAYIDTSLGPVIASLDEIDAKLVSIENGVAEINTEVGEIKVKLDALDLSAINAKLTSIENKVVTISTSIGDVQTTLDDINAKVVSIKDNVATIKTDVGSISGTVTSIDGNVATIKTDLGTVRTDVSAVKSSVDDVKGAVDDVKSDVETVPDAISGVTMPIWIAVILSLIAAIAAIASVVQISRKIAG